MKNYYRFAEPEELERFGENILEHFGGALSDGEVLKLFAERLEAYIKGRLADFELCSKKDLKKPLTDCFDIARKSFDRIDDLDEKIEKSYQMSAAATGGCLVAAIKEKKLEEAIAEALRFAGIATYKSANRSYDRFAASEFDPLFGRYPQVEDMSPSSTGGMMASVIHQARQVWGVDRNTCIESYPEEKHKAALFIKRTKIHVFQYAVRSGSYWKDYEHQTPFNTHEHLRCQIDAEIVMMYLQRAHGAEEALAIGVSQAEVYSIYASIYAFEALDELASSELNEEIPDQDMLDYYSKEAHGFIYKALEFEHKQALKEAGHKAISKHQGEKGKKKSLWRIGVEKEITEKLSKAGPQKSKHGFSKSILNDIILLREQLDNGRTWADQHTALQYVDRKVRDIHNSIFPEK